MTKVSIVVATIFILISFCSCSDEKKEKDPVCVIYKVVVEPSVSGPVFVAYKDTAGYITLRSDTSWSKEVYLPRKTVASLLVVSHEEDIYCDFDDIVLLRPSNKSTSLLAEIIVDEKGIMERGKDVASVSFYIP